MSAMTTPQKEKGPLQTLNDLLHQSKSQIALALPKHMTPERMIRVALTAFSKTPALQKCTPRSIVGAVIQASELGLEISGVLGHAYLVPYWNKNVQATEAQFQVGYRGLIDLAHRSGRVKSFYAHEVCQNDEFNYRYGSKPFVHHKPADKDRGEITHVYAVCLQTNGGVDFEVMSKSDIDAHRQRYSKSTRESPWDSAWPEMAKKTVIRKLAKRVPLSVELTKAAVLDEYAESDVGAAAGTMTDGGGPATLTLQPGKMRITDAVAPANEGPAADEGPQEMPADDQDQSQPDPNPELQPLLDDLKAKIDAARTAKDFVAAENGIDSCAETLGFHYQQLKDNLAQKRKK